MLKIAAIQIDLAFGDPAVNRLKIKNMIEKASVNGPDVIVLPEMWNTSFSMNNLKDLADREGEPTKSMISELSRKYHVNIVAGSIADRYGDKIYNRLYVANRQGEIHSYYDKVHLVRHAREDEYLTAGNTSRIFSIDGIACGAIICYDIRFPELSRALALKGAKILFIPAQWPETRIEHWKALAIARAIENQMYVVAVNRIGSEFKATFPGNSLIVDPWGKVLAESNCEETILESEIDIDLVERIRRKVPCFQDRNEAAYGID
ncbi:Carbon-nitrogen hydrolase [Geosporobacter subterraneus DSM 17957]|uniref:Carbon-nitrogen hydrolase n=1 Tax=Geosporobacter subterraneus DSM 17957 TaxID=1121919 RepID=A0A1M6N4S8_9FIRM|nr:carbon-nitrogen family hydrolase [Geosporobacter subterraneus]SHJ90729.1 Carbon-nitrogen hydrolase [Geosporobacter subterraneus DSM 17957]